MWLADEFYFIAHDDRTGRPRLHPRASQLGLAAALLGELLLAERITIHNGRIGFKNRQPPRDALAHTVLDQLSGQLPHPDLGASLALIGQDASDSVARRLERAGHLSYVETRRLMRTTGRWTPTDTNRAAWPAARLGRLLTSNSPMSWPDILLTGLASATGLSGQLLWDDGPQAGERLNAVLADLPDPFAELVAHTEAAVGNAILAHRR